MAGSKLLVVQAAALGHRLLEKWGFGTMAGMRFLPLEGILPGVTCSVQATVRTGTLPSSHGMVGNFSYSRSLRRPLFWEQSSALVEGGRIWDGWRDERRRVGLLFWQQSLGEAADCILSPAPIHRHGGGIVPSLYGKPRDIPGRVLAVLGRSFRLWRYWGPLASTASSDWIADATLAVLRMESPELCCTYLPALDYDLQRWGPGHVRSEQALRALASELGRLRAGCEDMGYDMLVYGDYAIVPVDGGAAHPNRALRDAGLLAVREVAGRQYVDLHESAAFVVADHELGHVYTRTSEDTLRVASALRLCPGIGEVLDAAAQEAAGIRHANSGDLILTARDGWWLAYPWWESPGEAPDYASHVDIHNKPGYDPCELFFGRWPPRTCLDTGRIRGTHGRAGPGREVAWGASFTPARAPRSLADLGAVLRGELETRCG